MHRNSKNYKIQETWDVLGMRATKSDDTLLEGVFVPDERIARVLGPKGFIRMRLITKKVQIFI
jgi:alkylation response protein AidB-like acyl-CoA dehydrogenase